MPTVITFDHLGRPVYTEASEFERNGSRQDAAPVANTLPAVTNLVAPPGQLFLAEPTGSCQIALRRFEHSVTAGEHHHDAEVIVEAEAPCTPLDAEGNRAISLHQGRFPHDDPRWPQKCECGVAFPDPASDHWQVNELWWYEGGGHRFVHGIGHWRAPVGCMIRAPWLDGWWPDNGCLPYVIWLPNDNEWFTPQPSSRQDSNETGPQWQITGTPPKITVSPSIFCRPGSPKSWHGFISDGVLVGA